MKCEYDKVLADKTSFRIGGKAFCWVEAGSSRDILEAISMAENTDKPLMVIGNGSNILAQDTGFDGILINLGKGFDFVEIDKDGVLKVGSGTSVPSLIEKAKTWNLTGCEFLSGIPGTIGGAIFMNAGVRGIEEERPLREIKDIIIDIEVLDLKKKKIKTLKEKDVDFKYRYSGLDHKCILAARIKLEKDSHAAIVERIDSYLKRREWLQKLGFPSAGSVFKNPSNAQPAGRLIDRCGLKGMRIGKAEISKLHANIIVNRGGASSEDVVGLINMAKRKVQRRFGIDLELEIKVL